MLKRKIETDLLEWKKSENRKPLVIKGIRQCGKTYIVQKFAKESKVTVSLFRTREKLRKVLEKEGVML